MRSIKRQLSALLIFSCLLFGNGLFSEEEELLKIADVHKVMQQIFAQHVDKKQMSESILRNSFRVYINQFDPDRIYLLESEIAPYLQISGPQMRQIMAQYQQNDYSVFEELNRVIEHAVARARDIRQQLEGNESQFFSKSVDQDSRPWRDADRSRPFAKTLNELKGRIQEDMQDFVIAERRRFGDAELHNKQKELLALYENFVRGHENQYLFQDDKGIALVTQQRENLQSMHILKALASSLDAHTSVFDPSEAYDMRARLEKSFQGVGIIVKRGVDGIVVTRIVPNSPAARNPQVHLGDYLLKIDGKEVNHESLESVMEMLRGKTGSEVTLTLKNGSGAPLDVRLAREDIVINEGRVETSYEQFANGIIGKITLHSFYQGNGISSEGDIRQAIRELNSKGNLRGLILDLRDNSGGFLSQAVKVAGLFITNGVVVVSKYSNGEERYYRDMDGKVAYDGPLVVLTSRLTASAAEIVAQALQDYGVAVIVGDSQTYGKGTIQSQTVTDKGGRNSYFKVTVGKYYTVSGKTPQIQGVKADIVAPSQYSTEEIGEGYLEHSLNQDRIEPTYSDQLKDIDPGLKPWYLRYYMPTLQGQKKTWREALPKLRQNSVYRIDHNKNYQNLLKGNVDSIDEYATNGRQRAYGIDDMQLNEAVNVVKDMIIMESRMQQPRDTEITSNQTGVVSEPALNK